MKKVVKVLAALLVLALVVGQVLPFPPAENPPVEEEVAGPPEVMSVLRTSCYDCHSNETVWPWYSHVVPAKWFVRLHVEEGRRALNFSAWNRYDAERRAHKLEEVVEMVEEGEMPLASYLLLHGDAELTVEGARLLMDWARAGAGAPEVREETADRTQGDDPGTF